MLLDVGKYVCHARRQTALSTAIQTHSTMQTVYMWSVLLKRCEKQKYETVPYVTSWYGIHIQEEI